LPEAASIADAELFFDDQVEEIEVSQLFRVGSGHELFEARGQVRQPEFRGVCFDACAG
jgi:hypothetical protein